MLVDGHDVQAFSVDVGKVEAPARILVNDVVDGAEEREVRLGRLAGDEGAA